MPPTTTSQQPHPSSFDAHHPPEKKYIDDCVHCGFCLPACPTYVLWGEEMDSPRGRIYMIKKAAEGQAPLDERFRLHMDNCLGCMACMTACPSGVQYDKLIEPARAQIERNLPRSLGESLFRRLLFATFPYPARLRLLALPLRIYQKCGIRSLVRSTGMTRLLPKRLAAMEALLPDVPARLFQRPHSIDSAPDNSAAPRRNVKRMRATSLLLSCERSHYARAGRGRLRSDHSPRTIMLRGSHAPLRNGSRCCRPRQENDRRLRDRQSRHDCDQLGRLRVHDEGIRSPAARRPGMG